MVKKGPEKGVQSFYITKYDPRVLHPRQLISRNYHHIQSNPVLANLFPRENMVAGTRRLQNLSEILSPTVQSGVTLARDDQDNNTDGMEGGMDHTIANPTRRSIDVMYVATWRKLPM